MRRSQINRADLVRMLHAGYGHAGDLVEFAASIGLAEREPGVETKKESGDATAPEEEPAKKTAHRDDAHDWPRNCEDAGFWLAQHFESRRSERKQQLAAEDAKPAGVHWSHAPATQPVYEPLSPWRVLEPRLREALQEDTIGRQIDIRKAVRLLANGRMLEKIPRLPSKLSDKRLTIVTDRSNRLVPYWHDQDLVFDALSQQLPGKGIRDCVGSVPEKLAYVDGDAPLSFSKAALPDRIVVLGDLGVLQTHSQEQLHGWYALMRRLANMGVKIVALVPCAASRIPRSLRAVVTIVSWQTKRSEWVRDVADRGELVERILTLLAPVIRLEPGLLRDVRIMLSGDASIESDIWQHWAVRGPNCVAASLDEDYSRKLLDQYQVTDLAKRVLRRIRHWRHRFRDLPFVWFEEIARLQTETRTSLLTSAEIKEAFAGLRSLHRARGETTEQDAYVSRLARRLPDYVRDDPEIGALAIELCAIAAGTGGLARPDEVHVGQSADAFLFGANATGSPIALLGTATTQITVLHPPPWASDWGTDQYGQWVEFQVAGMSQRMRWIPAGSFRMGSLGNEPGRFSDEGPQREVKLTRGFWMFETPVIQELWTGVMGNNPSSFKGDRRPVECVSWDDAQEFATRLNQQTGLGLTLPTEGQWEYACRAGTTTAYAFGDEISKKQANFAGKSTVNVATYPPNAWGLYDMHGNVREWCQDYWSADYSGAETVDPRGPLNVHNRVLRGGCWLYDARLVRSAVRFGLEPGFRYGNIGFRCAQVQGQAAEPQGGGWPPDGAQAVPTTSGGAVAVRLHAEKPQSVAIPHARCLIIKSDTDTLKLKRITKPGWASAIGRDRYGLWAEFSVANRAATASVAGEKVDLAALSVKALRAQAKELRIPTKGTRAQLQREIEQAWKNKHPPDAERKGVRAAVVQRMRWIPPGRFLMGSPQEDEMAFGDEKPQHEVTLSHGYWLFDTPVTQALWLAIMSKNPSQFQDSQRPVESVSWEDCQTFLQRINAAVAGIDLSLPTEAEWEHACRAGTITRYAFGDDISPAQANYFQEGEKETPGTSDVGSYKANAWGLFDMHGNVDEWCHDGFTEYSSDAQLDPRGPAKGRSRAVRGGGWNDFARSARSAYRYADDPGNRDSNLGFRCVRVHPSSRGSE